MTARRELAHGTTGTEWLTRLRPAAWGRLPRGRFDQHWFEPAGNYQVSSQRPINGYSTHLVSLRRGEWLAYLHRLSDGERYRLGNSAAGIGLRRLFGVTRDVRFH